MIDRTDQTNATPGVWMSLKRILDALLATTQTRVELFAIELQEEKSRVVEALLCAVAVAAFGMMSLSLMTFTLVVLFWENGRLPALIGLSLLYLLATAVAWRMLQTRVKAHNTFSETLNELKKDRACLGTDI